MSDNEQSGRQDLEQSVGVAANAAALPPYGLSPASGSQAEPAAANAWSCIHCQCKTYARVDEWREQEGFTPSGLVRCINCKSVFDEPLSLREIIAAQINVGDRYETADRILAAIAKAEGK